MSDHTPIVLIKAVLEQAGGAEVDGAYNAVYWALHNRRYRRSEAWMVEQRPRVGAT
jgi:hypothetical protein